MFSLIYFLNWYLDDMLTVDVPVTRQLLFLAVQRRYFVAVSFVLCSVLFIFKCINFIISVRPIYLIQ